MSVNQVIEEGVRKFQLGNFKEAESIFEKSPRDGGASGDDCAERLEWLGRTRTWLGKYDRARQDLDEARGIRAKKSGEGGKDVAITDLYRCDLELEQERFEPAQELAGASLATIEKENCANDLILAGAVSRLGKALSYLNETEAAEALLNKALGIRRSRLGEDSAEVASTLDDLSVCHAIAGNFTLAGALGRKALSVKEKAYGAEHPEVGLTLYHLCDQYVQTRMYEKAEPIARRGLDLLSRALPEPHVHVVRVSERLANISLAKGNLKEAEELHKKALDGAEEIWGADHPGIVTNLVGLGSTYYSRLDFKRAEKYFKRSLTVMEKSSQIDTGQEYSLLRNLSCCYIAQLKLGDALSLVPATQRASYTAEVTSILDLVGTLVKFVGKQVDGYKKDRGEY